MEVKILNQFNQTWMVDGHVQKDIFRTHETLEQLKERLDFNGYVTDGEWKYDGVVTCVFGILNTSQRSLSKTVEFNKKPFGKEGYHTLDEILESDLVWVKGYGVIDDKEDFKTKFEDAAQKK